MLRLMGSLIVNVDISTLDVGKGLKLDLEFLGDIVGSAQGLVGFHDDVNFDKKTGTGGVCAHSVDGGDKGGVGHCCGDKSAYGFLE